MIEHPLKTMHVRYKGVFDLDGLYALVHRWYRGNRYRTQENKYKNKPDSPWGYEHEIKLMGEKNVDAMHYYQVKIVIHGRDCAEVEIDGKKVMNGRVHITIDATVKMDYSERFEKNGFTKMLEKIYFMMVKREFELLHWDMMHYKLHRLQEDIKKHLNMYTDVNW